MRTRISIFVAALTLVAAASVAAAGDAFTLREIPESAWDAPSGASGETPSWLDGAAGADASPSMKRAILYSLILPGWGDYYAGRRERARYFFIAEGAIWTSFAVFRIQASRDEDAYRDFAVQFAGVSSADHSDDFYAQLREWDSSDDYEAFIKQDGRFFIYPDVGYRALDAYYLENRLSDFEPWQWESLERRLEFAELRSASKAEYRRSHYSIFAAAVNRLVSALFAYQAVKSQRGGMEQGRYHIEFNTPQEAGYGAEVSIVRAF